MKNLVFVFLAFFAIATLQSCQKSQPESFTASGSTNGSISQYCQAIDDYVAANYPNCKIESVTIKALATAASPAKDYYTVDLDGSCPCLLFDLDCNFVTQFSGDCPQ